MAQKGIIELVVNFGVKTNKMRVPQSMPVWEVLMDIWKKLGDFQRDHGLFINEDKEKRRKGQWLKPEKNLKFYGIQDGDEIQYKKKHGKIKYILLDGASKTVRIDLSHSVEKIVERIAKGIGIHRRNTFEFGLRSLDDRDGWLIKPYTLYEQGINIDNVPDLLFSRQFYASQIDDKDDFQLHLYYLDAVDKIKHEDYAITRKEAIMFAGFALQVMNNDMDEIKHTVQWLNLSNLLPESWHSDKTIKEDILNEWKKQAGFSQKQAKARYFQLLNTVRYYGYHFFVALQPLNPEPKKSKRTSGKVKEKPITKDKRTSMAVIPKSKSSKNVNVSYGGRKEVKASIVKDMQKEILEKEQGIGAELDTRTVHFGVGFEGFVLLDENGTPLNKWDANEFKGVEVLRATVVCTFPKSKESELRLRSVHAERIAHAINGYINIRYRLHKDDDLEYSASEEDNLAQLMEIQYDPQTGAAYFLARPEEGWALHPNGSIVQPESAQIKVVDISSAKKASAFLSDELGCASGFQWVNPKTLTVEDATAAFNQARAALGAKFDEILGTVRRSPGQLTRTQLDPLCSELFTSAQQVATRAQSLAAFSNRGVTPYITGAKAIADAINGMFGLLEKVVENPEYPNLEYSLQQCERSGRRALMLLEQEGALMPICDSGTTLLMLRCADEINNNMNDVLLAAGKIASDTSGPGKNQLESELQKVGVAKDWLIPTIKNLAPVLLDDRIRNEINIMHTDIGNVLNSVIGSVKKFGNPNSKHNQTLMDAARGLTNALAHLLSATQSAEPQLSQSGMDFSTPALVMEEALTNVRRIMTNPMSIQQQPILETQTPSIVEAEKLYMFFDTEINDGKDKPNVNILQSLDKLRALINDISHPARAIRPDELSKQLRMCEKAAAQIMEVISPLSSYINHPELKNIAAQLQAEISLMQQLAVGNLDYNELSNSLSNVEKYMSQLNTMASENAAMVDLRLNAKKVAARAVTLVDESNHCILLVSDPKMKKELQIASDDVSKGLTDFLTAVQKAALAPNDRIKQMELLSEARKQTPKFGALVNEAKTAGRFIDDVNKKQDLFDASTKLKDSIITLMGCITTVDNVTGESSIEAALVDFDSIRVDLDTAEFSAANGLFRPIPGQTRENALELLTRATKTLVRAANGLTSASKAGEKLPDHIKGCANGISQVAAAVRAVASTIDDKDTQAKVVAAGKAVNVETLNVIDGCRQLSIDKDNINKQKQLGKALAKWKGALTTLLETPKDLADKDIKEASNAINEGLKALDAVKNQKGVKSDVDLQEASQALVSTTKVLAASISQLSTMVLTNPLTLGYGAKVVGMEAKQLAMACVLVVSATESSESRDAFITSAKNLLNKVDTLLDLGQAATITKTRQALDNFKTNETSVKEGITNLLQSLGSVMSQETQASLNTIASLIKLLEDDGKVKSAPSMQRAEILEKFVQGSQVAARACGTLARVAKTEGAPKLLGISAKEAVDGLQTLVDCSRAASKTAKEGKDDILKKEVAQELRAKTLKVAEDMVAHIRAATAVSVDANEVTGEELAKTTNSVNNSVQQLIEAAGILNPGTRQCESAGKVALAAAMELDAALLTIASGGKIKIPSISAKNLVDSQSQTSGFCKNLVDYIQTLVDDVSVGNADGVANSALNIEKLIPNLSQYTLGTAGMMEDPELQSELLETGKYLFECLSRLFGSTKVANKHDNKSLEKVMADRQATNDAIGRLLNGLQSEAQLISELENVVSNIDKNITQLSLNPSTKSKKRFQQLRNEMNIATKELIDETRKLVVMDMSNKGEVGFTASRIGELTGRVITVANEAIAVTPDPDAKQGIKSSIEKAAEDMKQMIIITSDIAKGQKKGYELNETFKNTNVSTTKVLEAMKAADVVELLTEQALKTLNTVVPQLNTTALFAQAGQFEVDEAAISRMTVKQLQDKLKASLKEVDAVTTKLVSISTSTTGTDQDFGNTTIALSDIIKTISVQVTQNAYKFHDGDSKQKILNAAKNLASECIVFIPIVRDVHGDPSDKMKQMALTTAQNTISAKVASVLEVLETAGAALVKGEKELSSTIKKVDGLIKNPESAGTTNPQDLIKAARDVMGSTSELTFALTQDELIGSSKKAYTSIKDLISRSKAAGEVLTKDTDAGQNVLKASKNTATAMIKLLEASKLSKTEENQKKVEAASDAVGSSLDKFVISLKAIPGCENLSLDEDNIEFEEKAENELKKCAQIIEEAANALLQIQPRRKIVGDITITKEDINNAILTSAGAIASATKDLILCAEVAQSERKQDAKNKGTKFHVDPAWANGLISAAHQVAGAVKTLVSAANSSVEGKAQQEALVATSHQVAQATAHLVAASKAKSDNSSKAIIRLGKVARDVANATSQVVEAAAKAARWEEEEAEKEDKVDFDSATGKVKEMELQMKILKLEADLDKERRVLARMRQDRYRKAQVKK